MNPLFAMLAGKATDILIDVAIELLDELKNRPDNDVDQKVVDTVKRAAGKPVHVPRNEGPTAR